MSQEIKEKLKPPFEWNLKARINLSDCVWLQLYDKDYSSPAFPVVNYLEFITAAMTEKYERDFAEPLKWIFEYNEEDGEYLITCPKCKKTDMYSDDNDPPDLREQKYCCHCGQRLDPPEGDVL